MSASLIDTCRPLAAACAVLVGLPSLIPVVLRSEGGFCALGDQPALLLGQRRVEVQHEWIGVGAEFGDDERHALGHKAGDEGDVAGEAIELGDDDRALAWRARARAAAS